MQQIRRVSCGPVKYFWQYPVLLSFQDVLLQLLMADNIQLNQIDAEDPEVRKYRILDKRMASLVWSFIKIRHPSPRSQITPCCRTRGVCQISSECVYRRAMKPPGTSPRSLICRCSICQLTPCPKSSGENAKYTKEGSPSFAIHSRHSLREC